MPSIPLTHLPSFPLSIVLNLIITGMPSILYNIILGGINMKVLNLIITGMPSIPHWYQKSTCRCIRFKPYYNWNAFNTFKKEKKWLNMYSTQVLNLIITGMPSIQNIWYLSFSKSSFVLNLIITGMPSILKRRVILND